MTHSAGCDSRFCFFLCSKGDPKRAIEDNHKTVLHTFWNRQNFFSDLPSFVRAVCWMAPVYLCGMVGYLVDTLVKTILVFGNTLVYLISLCAADREWMNKREIICLDTLAALGISIVGILIPPLAYYLDNVAKLRLTSKVI